MAIIVPCNTCNVNYIFYNVWLHIKYKINLCTMLVHTSVKLNNEDAFILLYMMKSSIKGFYTCTAFGGVMREKLNKLKRRLAEISDQRQYLDGINKPTCPRAALFHVGINLPP